MAEPDAAADAQLPAGMRLAMIEGLVDNLQVSPDRRHERAPSYA